jgi:HAMP domain-containing protein
MKKVRVMKGNKLKAQSVLLAAAVATFAVAAIVAVWLVHTHMDKQALLEASNKARLILDRNLATHTYFSHQLKPKVFAVVDKVMPADYFEPVWMSSTYAIRGIDQYFKSLSQDQYYYKECAINARNPLNEADDYEKVFIQELNVQPGLNTRETIRVLGGKPYFVFLRRGEVMEWSCLRCHSQPQAAPQDMVKLYGAQRSFYRDKGEVVSAISIRVPLSEAFGHATGFSWKLSTLLLAVLSAMVLVLFFIFRRTVQGPLNDLQQHVRRVGHDSGYLDRQIPLDYPPELNELARAFNQMSANLKASHDELEERVRKRTAELEKALTEVKQLSGLLPICAKCKKIRDDQGYWQQIESYIRDHSEAEFTHGLCPECCRELYPNLKSVQRRETGKKQD